jgi:hypothetical protein
MLRTYEHARPNIALLLEVGLRALTDASCQDIGHILRELRDVLAYPNQQSRGT